jgi:hypothetical protein
MPAKFDFLSPGVLLREVDQSQVPAEATDDGILIIGTAPSGPAMKPVRVRDLDSFLEIFGNPSSGKVAGDVWRNPSFGPTYGMYAAQAWLSAESSPVTYVRLLGEKHGDHTTGGLLPGWSTTSDINTDIATNGGAYGLFVGPSGSTATFNQDKAATLAAVIYCDKGGLRLKGTRYGVGATGTTASVGRAVLSLSTTAAEFEIEHRNQADDDTTSYVFNFDKSASNSNSNYIRTVFPTNPEKTNSNIYAANNELWLGETYEESVNRMMQDNSLTDAGEQWGILVHLGHANKAGWAKWQDHRREATAPKSGWFISQDFGLATSYDATNAQKLFRIVGLHEGEWLQRNYQIGIEISRLGNNVNPYSSFHLYVMDMQENMIEQYKNLNFNPGSENYIAKRIGDQFQTWDDSQKKHRVEGEYENKSDYIYVELSEAVKNGSLDSLAAVPFGVQGPVTYDDFYAVHNATVQDISSDTGGATAYEFAGQMGVFNSEVVFGNSTGSPLDNIWGFDFANAVVQFTFPKLRLTTQNGKGSNNSNYATKDFLGVDHSLSGSSTFDESYFDLVRQGAKNSSQTMEVNLDETGSPGTGKVLQYFFTMDDIRFDTASSLCFYHSGSRQTAVVADKSETALNGIDSLINTRRIRKFKSPLFGGFDGVNIKEANPFANHVGVLSNASNEETNNYAVFSVMKALNTVADEEVVSYDLLSVPGITNTKITDRVLEICSDRGDALGIIDLADGFEPANVEATSNQNGSVATSISTLVGRNINTSYGAAYYPWIRLRDTIGGNNDVLMAPPSVAAIGAIARSEAVSEPWFAPAGFNRGGIRQLGGARGPQCVGTWEHLTKDNRDDLYQNNINPIARFPAINEIVIFGQKTLQQTPSALDRINVRRLMIFLKKAIKNIADTILFDQNVNTTWLRFRSQADQVLSNVRTRLGITDYKIVLDKTTTTPDLIDRNILYAKIFVKPARSIEFIAVDFIITRTGVEF